MFSRIAKPACVMSVKVRRLPSLTRTPSGPGFHPASSCIARDFAGSNSSVATFGSYAHESGWMGPFTTVTSSSRIVFTIVSRSTAYAKIDGVAWTYHDEVWFSEGTTLHALRRYGEEKELALRYARLFPQNAQVFTWLAQARLELGHDVPAFLRELEQVQPLPDDPLGLVKSYRLALARGDLAAADRVLADSRPMIIYGYSAVIIEPVALHRAQVAWLRGQMKEARAFADEALTYYSSRPWVSRQEPWVMSYTALAQALGGRADEALRLARESVVLQDSRDVFDAKTQRYLQAQVCLILDRRDEALAGLGEVLQGPFFLGPEQIRLDPFWSRLKDDPRFEEILKSAKPL